jgi:hypothetical protein
MQRKSSREEYNDRCPVLGRGVLSVRSPSSKCPYKERLTTGAAAIPDPGTAIPDLDPGCSLYFISLGTGFRRHDVRVPAPDPARGKLAPV